MDVTIVCYRKKYLQLQIGTSGMSELKSVPNNSIIPRSGARSTKFKRLVDVLQEMIDKEFTGHIKINFSQGGIGKIEKFEEILRGGLTGEEKCES